MSPVPADAFFSRAEEAAGERLHCIAGSAPRTWPGIVVLNAGDRLHRVLAALSAGEMGS